MNIKNGVNILCLLFIAFPFTKIFEFNTYTQPYAFLFCFLIFFLNLKHIFKNPPQKDFLFLTLFLAFGLIMFLLTCFPYNNIQEYKYLLNYISPFIITLSAYYIIKRSPKRTLKIFIISLYFWLFISLIQRFISPDFLTFLVAKEGSELGINLSNSGRGAIGLSPESTHNGFHLLLLSVAISLLGGRNLYLYLSIIGATILAMSSSAVLAFLLGILFFTIFRFRRFIFHGYGFLISISLGLLIFALSDFFYEYLNANRNLRILSLISTFIENPLILLEDYSVNARIGGIIAGWNVILSDLFLPHGLSHKYWLETRQILLTSNTWLFGLSGTGIPSGITIIFFQIGVLGLIILYPFYRISTSSKNWLHSIFYASVFFIFLSQLMLSTPLFSVIYAAAIYKRQTE